jgi:cell division protein FtsX
VAVFSYCAEEISTNIIAKVMLDFVTVSYTFSAVVLVGFTALVIRNYSASQKHYAQLQRSIAERKAS